MYKFSFIFVSSLLLSNDVFAIEQNIQGQTDQPSTQIQTLNWIERTNLDTQNFIWQIKLIPNHVNKSITPEFVTPHPSLTMLNKRALEIADNYQYEQLISSTYPQTTIQNIAPSEHHQPQSYLLHVRFPQGLVWKKRPRFNALATYSKKYCDLKPNHPDYEKAIIHQNRDLTFETKLYVNANGTVNSIDLLNPSSDIKLNQYIYKELVSAKFYPYNENGIPIGFHAVQPIRLTCQN